MIDIQPYTQRRARLLRQMQYAICRHPDRNPRRCATRYTIPIPVRQQFLLLSGFSSRKAVLVLIAGAAAQSILFCREKNPSGNLGWSPFWPLCRTEKFGFDAAYPLHNSMKN